VVKFKIALSIVVVGLLYFGYQARVSEKSFHNTLALNELSEPLRSFVLNVKSQAHGSFNQPWLIVKITKNAANFYTNINPQNTYKLKADYNQRVNTMREFIAKIQHNHKKKLPIGEYIISLREGLNYYSTYPVLAFSSTVQLVQQGHIVLMPDPDAIRGYDQLRVTVDHEQQNFPWQRRLDKIFWRGPATGYNNPTIQDINTIARIKFMNRTKDLKFVNAGFTDYTQQWPEKFLQQLKKSFPLQPQVTQQSALAYKYLINIDGNACTYSPMAFILYSQSLLLKPRSDNIQWYYHKLQPYVHYLPVAEDFSDLEAKYFWAQSHQSEDRTMANNAHNLALEVFNEQAIIDATIEAFTKYKQLASHIT